MKVGCQQVTCNRCRRCQKCISLREPSPGLVVRARLGYWQLEVDDVVDARTPGSLRCTLLVCPHGVMRLQSVSSCDTGRCRSASSLLLQRDCANAFQQGKAATWRYSAGQLPACTRHAEHSESGGVTRSCNAWPVKPLRWGGEQAGPVVQLWLWFWLQSWLHPHTVFQHPVLWSVHVVEARLWLGCSCCAVRNAQPVRDANMHASDAYDKSVVFAFLHTSSTCCCGHVLVCANCPAQGLADCVQRICQSMHGGMVCQAAWLDHSVSCLGWHVVRSGLMTVFGAPLTVTSR